MEIRILPRVSIYLFGSSADKLDPEVTFQHGDLTCTLRLRSDTEAIENPAAGASPDDKFVRHVPNLDIAISDNESGELGELLREDGLVRLGTLAVEVCNRCIRAMRNYGFAPGLTELSPEKYESAEPLLRAFGLETHQADEDWEPRFDTDPITLAFAGLFGSPPSTASIRVRNWLAISEAIVENLEPPPEYEFSVNAIEQLNARHLRLALLEAIIGLEIVLTRYLRSYLAVRRGFTNSDINAVVTPNLTLSLRVNLLLRLLKFEAPKFDHRLLRKAIKWRNTIVHRTGKLPSNVDAEGVREAIWEVVGLTERLAHLANQTEASPGLQPIQEQLREERGHTVTLTSHRGHDIVAVFLINDEDATQDEMLKLVERIVPPLRERDASFEPERHLTARFAISGFPPELAGVWREGELTLSEPEEREAAAQAAREFREGLLKS